MYFWHDSVPVLLHDLRLAYYWIPRTLCWWMEFLLKLAVTASEGGGHLCVRAGTSGHCTEGGKFAEELLDIV